MSTSIVANAVSLTFDSCVERYSMPATATQHPVENGVSITDHLQAMPETVVFEGTMTQSPLAGSAAVVLSPSIAPFGSQRVDDARQYLRGLQGRRENTVPILCNLLTERFGILNDYVLNDAPHTIDKGLETVFQCSFSQVRVAVTANVAIQPTQTANTGAPDEVNAGARALIAQAVVNGKIAAANAAQNAKNRSKASSLAGAVGAVH